MKNTILPCLSLGLLLALLGGIPAGPLAAAPYSPPVLKPATNGSRFLFVFEMSSAMKSTDAANRQALFDMIFTGFDGQMRQGDSFGLWLFSDEVRAGEFPLQVWDEQNPLEVASRATQFVRTQKYSGKAHMEEVMPRLLQLGGVVRDVHLVLISSGEQPIRGTPFDASLNEAYNNKQTERRRHEKPLITMINVRGGKVVSAAVTLAGQHIKLPERPAPIVAVPAEATNKTATAAAPPPEPPRTAAVPTAEPGPPTKVWTPANPPATNLAPRTEAPPVAVTIATSTPASEPAPVETNAVAPTPAPAVPVDATPPPPVEQAPAETPDESRVTPVPGPMPVMARQVAEPSAAPVAPAPSPATVVITQPGLSPTLLLVIGAVLLASCLTLLIVVLRRMQPPTQGSYITRSMDRH